MTKATNTLPLAMRTLTTVSNPKSGPVVTTKGVATATPSEPTKAKAHAVSKLDVHKFVVLSRTDSKAVAGKARIIGLALASGMTKAETVSMLTSAMLADSQSVSPSFPSAVTHYATAYNVAVAVKLSGDDKAIHAAYSISTGKVPAVKRDSFASTFRGESAEFVSACRALLVASIEAKKGAGKSVDPLPADITPESAVPTVVVESALPVESPLEDVKRLTRQLGKLLDLLADNSPDDYSTAVELVAEFGNRYAPIFD